MAKALRAPLAAGDLDGALAAAREVQPAHAVVQALELLLHLAAEQRAQPSPPPISALQEAALLLDTGQLLPALAACQRANSPEATSPIDAIRAVLRAAEEPLTMPEQELGPAPVPEGHGTAAPQPPSREAQAPPAPVFNSGLQFDDETRAILHPVIPTDAYREEPTMQVQLSDFQLVGEGPEETTRVAKPGELPLEELRKQVAEDSDAAIDGLLDALEPADAAPPEAETLDVGPHDASPMTAPERRGPTVPRAPTFEPPATPLPGSAPRGDTERPPLAPRGSHPPPVGFVPPPAPTPTVPAPQAAPRPTDEEPSRYTALEPSRVPEPPIPPIAVLSGTDPVHDPLETDLSLPADDHWNIDPGEAEDSTSGVIVSSAEQSWVGLRAFDAGSANFQPAVDPVATDNWADEVPTESQATPLEPASVQQAEALVAQGALGAALGVYQDLAAARPDDPRLWQRIEEIARALQRKSTPPE